MLLTDSITLSGEHVILEPLSGGHRAGLEAAASEPGLERLWYTSVPTPGNVASEIDRRLALRDAGTMNPWVQRRAEDGHIVGMTTFCNIDQQNRHVEIGHTWIAPSTQRTGLNTEAKLLLLGHAFDACDAIAVEFRTHWHNRQSRAAIARLGAKQDGVLRNQSIHANGSLRDTVVFSILPTEWPSVRTGLEARLASSRTQM